MSSQPSTVSPDGHLGRRVEKRLNSKPKKWLRQNSLEFEIGDAQRVMDRQPDENESSPSSATESVSSYEYWEIDKPRSTSRRHSFVDWSLRSDFQDSEAGVLGRPWVLNPLQQGAEAEAQAPTSKDKPEFSDILCSRCRSINIESISVGEGYQHSHPSELVESASTCRLCHVLAKRLRVGKRWRSKRYMVVICADKTFLKRAVRAFHLKSNPRYHASGHFHIPAALSMPSVTRLYCQIIKKKSRHGRGRRQYYVRRLSSKREIVYSESLPVYTDEDDFARHLGIAWIRKEVGNNTASAASFDVAKGWLESCLSVEAHPPKFRFREERPTIPEELPTRLIDIRPMAEGDGMVRLIETTGRRFRYAALSYCWGRPREGVSWSWRTTTATLDLHKKGIQRESLPPTLRDSVLICERLGLTHMWIDSLCIMQDSPSDWAGEARRMGGIYAGSTLTIAISASSSVHDGAFNECSLPYTNSHELDKMWIRVDGTLKNGRKSRLYIGQPDRHENFIQFYVRIGALSKPALFGSPLAQRAWALQEHLLSPRILFYTSTQLYWGCRHCMISEDNMFCGTVMREPSYRSPWTSDFEFSEDWYREIVEDYSKRKLSFTRDKLVAMSALARARAVTPGRGDHYVAGLWKNSLLHGLLWNRKGTAGRKIEQHSFPSWSWASQDSAVSYHMLQQPDESMFTPSVVDVKWQPDPENPFADVSMASIDLATRIATGYVNYESDNFTVLFPIIPGVDTWDDQAARPSWAAAYMDDSQTTVKHVAIAVVGYYQKSLVCLILDPPTLDANKFQRIGITWFGDKFGFGRSQGHDTSKWRNRVITLI